MSEESPRISVRATVDYLTITTKGEGQSGTMIHKLYSLLGQNFVSTAPRKPWKFMGFHGFAYEGVRYGLRKDEALVMLSGSRAAEFWREVAPTRRKCTRIDLAVTVCLPAPDLYVANDAYTGVMENGSVSATKLANTKGGATCYVGSRHSAFFGRLYDKGAEQGLGSGVCWRYEMETKKPASEAVISRLLETSDPGQWIASYVHTWFLARGVSPLFRSTNADSAIEIEAKVSTNEKALKWLSTQVKPTVGRLIIAGMEQDVRDALGIPETTNQLRLSELGGS